MITKRPRPMQGFERPNVLYPHGFADARNILVLHDPCRARSPVTRARSFRWFAALSERFHAFLDLRLVSAVDRLVVPTLLGQVLLIDPAAFVVVAVLVVGAVAELLRTLVMGVAQ